MLAGHDSVNGRDIGLRTGPNEGQAAAARVMALYSFAGTVRRQATTASRSSAVIVA